MGRTSLFGFVLVAALATTASSGVQAFDVKSASIVTKTESLNKAQLDALAQKLTGKNSSEGEDTLIAFFSLNRSDVELLLARLRARAAKSGKSELAKRTEAQLAAAITQLNDVSMDKFKVPFHLALARGEELPGAEILLKNGYSLAKPVNAAAGAAAAPAVCPLGTYSSYVSRKIAGGVPYYSAAINSARRTEDPGCNLVQGPFPITIGHWNTISLNIAVFVAMQGWGGSLATDGRKFFYKAWVLPLAGISTASLACCLWAKT